MADRPVTCRIHSIWAGVSTNAYRSVFSSSVKCSCSLLGHHCRNWLWTLLMLNQHGLGLLFQTILRTHLFLLQMLKVQRYFEYINARLIIAPNHTFSSNKWSRGSVLEIRHIALFASEFNRSHPELYLCQCFCDIKDTSFSIRSLRYKSDLPLWQPINRTRRTNTEICYAVGADARLGTELCQAASICIDPPRPSCTYAFRCRGRSLAICLGRSRQYLKNTMHTIRAS